LPADWPSEIAVAVARNGGYAFPGGSMRRVNGHVLAGLGAFFLVLTVLVTTLVASSLIKFPLNEYQVTTLEGTGVSYFSPHLVRQVPAATIRVTSTVKGVASRGSSSVAVWDGFTYLYDVTNSQRYQYTTRRVAFDRRTAELVNCCGANVAGDTSVRQSGLVGFLWPFGTRKKTYQVFDVNLNRPMPAHYTGTTTVSGITVYRFVERVTGARAGTQTLPGSLVGMPGKSQVTLPEFYTATNTFWVDPVTGAELNTSQDMRLTLRDPAGQQRLLLFNGDLKMTPPSTAAIVRTDRHARGEISLLTVIIPVISGVLGFVLLVIGVMLVRRRQKGQPEPSESLVTAGR
jgi:Porin PorA